VVAVVVVAAATFVMSERFTVVPATLTYVLLPEIVTEFTVPEPVTVAPDVSVVEYVAVFPIISNAVELFIELFIVDMPTMS